MSTPTVDTRVKTFVVEHADLSPNTRITLTRWFDGDTTPRSEHWSATDLPAYFRAFLPNAVAVAPGAYHDPARGLTTVVTAHVELDDLAVTGLAR